MKRALHPDEPLEHFGSLRDVRALVTGRKVGAVGEAERDGDRFPCSRLGLEISAGDCAARQRQAEEAAREQGRGGPCHGCELGAALVERLHQRREIGLVVLGAGARLVLGSQVYAVPAEPRGEERRGRWLAPEAIPAGWTADLTAREAQLLRPLLRQLQEAPPWKRARST